jgi:hypothetical protein
MAQESNPGVKSPINFPFQEDVMAKGQQRSTKEKKKPKAEWNKKKKGGPAGSPFAVGQGQTQTKNELFGKK